ncbi:hypothetical protein AALP_AA8G008000 [Arabis alpina]|uniref:Importin subunit beta-1/Transportin-1-like TPR repeats domain-containing protein n=1 Tax=Arabis alpina TaxID=50452 RepID=A0A087G454_ARAAL|nr:hypothetical protein AALP_AA8G008000 [Arabis alpina]
MTQEGSSSATLKQSTLETLGYVCEEISREDLVQDEVDSVIAVVVQGMNKSENSAEVCLAATKEAEIRQVAFECLVSVVSLNYVGLEEYMEGLVELTTNAINGDEKSVALQAVKFWSSVCDEEIDLQEFGHSCFIAKYLPRLVPILLEETLMKQEEDQDQGGDDISNISMVGGTCLGLFARTVGDDIVPLVTHFVEAKISDSHWRSREAATYALGSILEGPTIVKLAPLVSTNLEILLNATKDENKHVRYTTAWTLNRIFKFLHCPIITSENLPRIMDVLLEAINDVSNVEEKICGAICNLAQGENSSLLSPYLKEIIKSLLAAAERTEAKESKLRATAYETLNEVVRCSNLAQSSSVIANLLPDITGKLVQAMSFPIRSIEDLVQQLELQATLCNVLQVIIEKLSGTEDTKHVVMQNADDIMASLIKAIGSHRTSIHKEAMRAIGALAYATGPEFEKYMPELFKHIQMGLKKFKEYSIHYLMACKNFEECQLCSITVGVIGDICLALDDKILPYSDQIMTHLMENLQSDALHMSVKPPIFSCIGNIALAIGSHFETYLTPVLHIMQKAAQVCEEMDTSDKELMLYGKKLQKSILEAYSGILQGLKDAKAELLIPYAQPLHEFIEFIFSCKDHHRDGSVLKAVVIAMEDLLNALGTQCNCSRAVLSVLKTLTTGCDQKTKSSKKLRFGLEE